MIRIRRLALAAVPTAVMAFTGCVTSTETVPVIGTTTDAPPPVVPRSSVAALSSMISSEPEKIPVTEMAAVWMNRVAYLPDPTRNGEPGAGIAGLLLLLGPNGQFAHADGSLTVDLYDETPRQPGVGQHPLPKQTWQFGADALNKLIAHDERLGRSYTLFLPWPEYRPDVTRLKIMARYDPAGGGHPYFASPSILTLDNSPQSGSTSWSGGTSTVVPQVSGTMPGPTGLMPTPSAAAALPQAGAAASPRAGGGVILPPTIGPGR